MKPSTLSDAHALVCEHLSVAALCEKCIAKAIRRVGLADARPIAPASPSIFADLAPVLR